MFDLAGKVTFITGGARGIGRAVAERFIAAGAHVTIADFIDAEDVAKEIGAAYVRVDVSDEDSVAAALGKAAGSGKLDIVINNAGVGEVGETFEQVSQQTIERMTSINQWGVLYGLKYAPQHMNDHGSIINTASMAAFVNMVGSAVYSASKAAVVSMTRMAALELGARGIRVNAICPAYIETDMGSDVEGDALSKMFTALERKGKTADLVGVFHFLAADESSYITGQAIKVDGGWSCGPTPALLETVLGKSHVS